MIQGFEDLSNSFNLFLWEILSAIDTFVLNGSRLYGNFNFEITLTNSYPDTCVHSPGELAGDNKET
jgi:hypothetical protein